MKSMVLGTLEGGEVPAAIREEVLGESRAGGRGGRDLDHGLDLLTHVVVGDAEQRDVGHGGVAREHGLDLGRVHVDAAGDDHVALAIAEEEEAVSNT